MGNQQGQGLSGAIAQRQQERGQQVAQQQPAGGTVDTLLRAMTPEFAKVLPATLPPDTFVRLALTEVRSNPELATCSQASFLGALMTAARLNLEPGGPLGQFYLTTRNNKVRGRGDEPDRWEKQVVPIIGYRGLRDLALRSGKVVSIQSFIVREGDEFRYGSNETRGFWHEWIPADTDEDQSERDWKGVLTIAQLAGSGKPVWRYLTKNAVLARKNRGAAGDKGPWKTDEEAMVRKTGIRAIVTDLPSSSIMQMAVQADEQVQVWRAGDAAPRPAHQQIEAPAEQGMDPATGEVPRDNPEPEQPKQRRGRKQAESPQEPPADDAPPPREEREPVQDPGPWTPPGPDGRP